MTDSFGNAEAMGRRQASLTGHVVATAIRRAQSWMLHSGIQDINGELRVRGGVNAWYDLKHKHFTFLYSEITGYSIPCLLAMRDYLKDEAALDHAKYAADWLLRNPFNRAVGLVETRFVHLPDYRDYDGWAFTFDNVMCAYGLSKLYAVTRKEEYLRAALTIVDRLLSSAWTPEGMIFPIFDLDRRMWMERPDKWSTRSGSFLAKLTLCLSSLYGLTGEERYRSAAFRLGEGALRAQDASGRFVTRDDDSSTHLHPHCYTIEGLLCLASEFGASSFWKPCEAGLAWLWRHQSEDGGFPTLVAPTRTVEFQRSDILAQVLRLTLLLNSTRRLVISPQRTGRLVARLLEFQHDAPDCHDGGFSYGWEVDGERKDHLNAWCTMFAIQGLMLYEEFLNTGEVAFPRYFC